MLKVVMSVDANAAGELQPPKAADIIEVNATGCGDEVAGVTQAAAFMDKMGLPTLRVTFGRGQVQLKKGDDLAKKADALFYDGCCFDLYQIASFKAAELKFGEPKRAHDITEAAHSALRVAQKFGRNVSFKFNGIAVPPIEPKATITAADIKAVERAYSKAFDAKP